MPSEYPEDDSRTVPFQATTSESSTRRAPEVKTRYVDLPQAPERAAGPRNLAWGIIFLVAAFCAFWFANIISGRNAARSLIACLGTFGLVWLFYNLRVLRQRNGIFLAISTVLLFGAALPLVESGFMGLDRLARERLGDEESQQKLDVAPPPPMNAKNAPPAPFAPELAPEIVESEKPGASSPEDTTVRELFVPAPPATAKKIIAITEDVETKIGNRRYLVKKGDTFEFISIKDGMTTFKAGSDIVSVSSDYTQIKLKTEDLYALANKEAIRLYPGLADQFSEQHEKFSATWRELEKTLPEFFKSPDWPLSLARNLAVTNGWKSTDDLEDEANGKTGAPAAKPIPAAEPKTPPTESEVPQENPLPPVPDEQ